MHGLTRGCGGMFVRTGRSWRGCVGRTLPSAGEDSPPGAPLRSVCSCVNWRRQTQTLSGPQLCLPHILCCKVDHQTQINECCLLLWIVIVVITWKKNRSYKLLLIYRFLCVSYTACTRATLWHYVSKIIVALLALQLSMTTEVDSNGIAQYLNPKVLRSILSPPCNVSRSLTCSLPYAGLSRKWRPYYFRASCLTVPDLSSLTA